MLVSGEEGVVGRGDEVEDVHCFGHLHGGERVWLGGRSGRG